MISILSPKTSSGSFVYSLLAHGLIMAGVAVGFNLGNSAPAPVENYVDLGYEELEAPPMQAPPKPPVEEKMEELQDKTSEVAGVQKEVKSAPGDGIAEKQTNSDVPYYKIKPKYPKAALLAGKEGWVMLQVDINEKGEVENVRVIDGENRSEFQGEARRAVSLYKYRPFVDANGNPVRKADHLVRVEFNLVDAGSEEESRASL